LGRGCRQLAHAAVVDPDVDDQPGFVEVEIIEGDAELLAHGAGSAVAGDDVVGRDLARGAVLACQHDGGGVRVLADVDQGRAELDRHGRKAGDIVAHHLLDRRLREHHARRVAERVGLTDHVDAPDQLALGAEMLRCRKRRDVAAHLLGDAEIVEQPHDLMIERDRARLVVDLAGAVDRERRDAVAAEQARRDGAGRTEADDDDLIMVCV